jgi:putative ABC transport system permease protein
MALRIAIGASRGRIIRQILTESFLVALLGGVAGVCLAIAGIPAIARLIPPDTLAGASVGMNGAVLLFSAGLVVLSMFVSGLAPALHSTSGDLQSELKEGGKTTSAGARNRWRDLLATSEVALALILLVGAGLMMKSLYRLLAVDSGFRSEHVLKLEMDLRTRAIRQGPGGDRFLAANAGPRPRVARRGMGGARDRDSAHRRPFAHRHYGRRDRAEAGQFPASGYPHRQPGL